MKILRTGIALLVMLTTFACNNHSAENKTTIADIQLNEPAVDTVVRATYSYEEEVADGDQNKRKEGPGQSVTETPRVGNNNNPNSTPDWSKKRIMTADLRIEVSQYKKYDRSLRQLLQRYGAYIATEEQESADASIQNNMTIRVPVEQFDVLLQSLTEDSVTIKNMQVRSADVTAEMYDVHARLASKKKIRDRYEQLLQQAHKMDDILQIESQIGSIQEELDAAAGRLTYLKHQTSYSTINLSYSAPQSGVTDTPNGFGAQAIAGLKDGAHVFVEILLLLIRLWPLILVGTILVVIWKRKKLIIVKR